MASFEVLSAANGAVYPDSPESFDILQSGFYSESNCFENNGASCRNGTSDTIKKNDVEPNQMQLLLNELLQDNSELKEVLKKNNEAINSQLNALLLWHQGVIHQVDSLEKSLSEAKQEVSELHAVRDELLQKIKTLENNADASNEKFAAELTKLQQALNDIKIEKEKIYVELNEQMAVQDELQLQLGKITEERDSLLSICKILENSKLELAACNNDLQIKLRRLNLRMEGKGNEAYDITDDEGEYSIVFHPDFTIGKQEASSASDSAYQTSRHHSDESDKDACNTQSLVIQQLKEKCHSLQCCVHEYQKKFEQLQQAEDSKMKHFQQQIKTLQETVQQQQAKSEIDKANLQEAASKLAHLDESYEKALGMLDTQEREEKEQQEQMSTLQEIEQIHHIEQVDVLTAKLLTTEQQLEDAEHRAEGLRKEVTTLKEDAEMIPILKAQVELYKTDFETEKAACKGAQEEVNKLTLEIQLLRERLENMQDSSAHESCSSYKEKSRHHKSSKRSGDHDKKRKHGTLPSAPYHEPSFMSCEICGKSFAEYSSLEEHMNFCKHLVI